MKERRVHPSLVTTVVIVLLAFGSARATLPPPVDLETSGSGSSGSGSGSGSGEEREPNCRRPSHLIQQPRNREADVLPEIRCHVACLQHVSSTVTSRSY